MLKATDNHTPTSLTRRALALGAGAASAIGITAGATATAADMAAKVPTSGSYAAGIGGRTVA